MDDRIKRYSRIKYTLAVVDVIFLLIILILFQLSGLAMSLRTWADRLFVNQVLIIFFYCLVLFLLYFIFNFPLKLYRSYIVEHRFNLSKERFSQWFTDQVKEFFVSFFLFIILVEGFFYILRQYPHSWWWISSLFWVFFSVIIAELSPILIIPLFFKYKRISDQDLRQRILNLAAKMGINILDVYQIDFSKKTIKANAALTGLGKSKRVILTDTLQGKFSHDEIEVILAHELAHYRLGHLIKLLILNAGIILFIFYFLSKISGFIFGIFNLNLADIAGLGIWLICFIIFQVLFIPLLNWISRKMESHADYLAIKFTDLKQAFISMMEKLSEQNLVERKPSRWVKILFFDHPPVEERIAMVIKGLICR